jgi:hypothetical protein
LEKPDSPIGLRPGADRDQYEQRPLWLPYVEVDRVDEQTEHARSLAGSPPGAPDDPWFTRLRDASLEPKRKRPYGCMRSRETRCDGLGPRVGGYLRSDLLGKQERVEDRVRAVDIAVGHGEEPRAVRR